MFLPYIYKPREMKVTCLSQKSPAKIAAAGICAFFLTFSAPFSWAEPISGSSERAALFITGLSGSNQFKTYFEKTPELIRKTLLANGYLKENMVKLSEDLSGGKQWGREMPGTKENIDLELTRFAVTPKDYEEVFIFIAGHANGRDEEAMMHLPGDDMVFEDIIKKIDAISAKRIFLVVAAPQGETWIKKLGRPGRVIIAGNGYRQYDFIPMIFLRIFPEVFFKSTQGTDSSGKTKEVSLLDVFSETQEKIRQWYKNNKLQCTELALMDADGDAKGDSLFMENPDIEKAEGKENSAKGLSEIEASSGAPQTVKPAEFPLNLELSDAKASEVIYFKISKGEIA